MAAMGLGTSAAAATARLAPPRDLEAGCTAAALDVAEVAAAATPISVRREHGGRWRVETGLD